MLLYCLTEPLCRCRCVISWRHSLKAKDILKSNKKKCNSKFSLGFNTFSDTPSLLPDSPALPPGAPLPDPPPLFPPALLWWDLCVLRLSNLAPLTGDYPDYPDYPPLAETLGGHTATKAPQEREQMSAVIWRGRYGQTNNGMDGWPPDQGAPIKHVTFKNCHNLSPVTNWNSRRITPLDRNDYLHYCKKYWGQVHIYHTLIIWLQTQLTKPSCQFLV